MILIYKKNHLNKAEQIIKLDFYLRLQNTENFALSALREQHLQNNILLCQICGLETMCVQTDIAHNSKMD